MEIKQIVFDLGGVLLDIDYQQTVDAFHGLGMKEPRFQFSKAHQSALFQAYEKGEMNTTKFIEDIKLLLQPVTPTSEVVRAWCALLGKVSPDKISLLENLNNSGYSCFILSNTNELHQGSFEKEINLKYGWLKFSALFVEIYYSHQLGMRKPNANIFQYVLNKNKIKAEECLFIDDTEEHTKGAISVGINSHHLTENETLIDVLKSWGVGITSS
jgi:putative hydrolase of the HAD superfamily